MHFITCKINACLVTMIHFNTASFLLAYACYANIITSICQQRVIVNL